VSIKVLIADDHPVVREGLRAAIQMSAEDIEVAAEASNGREVLNTASKMPIDVFILDVQMPLLNGVETTSRLLRMNPATRVIVLSIHDSRSFVEKAIHAGARGYILKESSTAEIIRAIREVHNGKFFLSPPVTQYIVNSFVKKLRGRKKGPAFVNLTTREKEVLQLLAEGFASREIADKLYLSLNTVRVHKKNIRQKLGLHSQVDLVRYAIKEGISKL
jgi:DNA-binding NarL/FixJ family response regulator